MEITLTWERIPLIDNAGNTAYTLVKDRTSGIYLHVQSGKPFYWGKVEKSKFGGNRKVREDGKILNGRYNTGYRHWILGALHNWGELYFAEVKEPENGLLDKIENTLICTFGSLVTQKQDDQLGAELTISHKGERPGFIIGGSPKVSSVY